MRIVPWPIDFADVAAAEARIRPHLPPTPLRHYAPLDAAVGNGIRVLVKHEDVNPTNSFKVRNALSAMTLLDQAQRSRGVVAATRGNHGLGVAYASTVLGIEATICVPEGGFTASAGRRIARKRRSSNVCGRCSGPPQTNSISR